jgi:hypothetical protein
MKIHWRLVFPWVSRAWPVLCLAPIGVVHGFAWWLLREHASIVNKAVGVALQILGALIVLYSINDNLGLFRSHSLWTSITLWLRAFPFARPPVVGSGSSVVSVTAAGSARVSSNRQPTTLEERVEQLERHLIELQVDLEERAASLRKALDGAETRLQEQITISSARVADLATRIEHATVGGFKLQAMGVLIAVYGAVASGFA